MNGRMTVAMCVLLCMLLFGAEGAACGEAPPPFTVEIEGGPV